MNEFRPPDVIEADRALAERLIDGEIESLHTLVTRFGRAVTAVVGPEPEGTKPNRAAAVFANAWLERESIDPSAVFSPSLGGLAASAAGRSVADVADLWMVAMGPQKDLVSMFVHLASRGGLCQALSSGTWYHLV